MNLIKASCPPQREFIFTQNIAHETVVTGPDLAEFCRTYGSPGPGTKGNSPLAQGEKEDVDGTFSEPLLVSLSLISGLPQAKPNHGSPKCAGAGARPRTRTCITCAHASRVHTPHILNRGTTCA